MSFKLLLIRLFWYVLFVDIDLILFLCLILPPCPPCNPLILLFLLPLTSAAKAGRLADIWLGGSQNEWELYGACHNKGFSPHLLEAIEYRIKGLCCFNCEAYTDVPALMPLQAYYAVSQPECWNRAKNLLKLILVWELWCSHSFLFVLLFFLCL